MKRLATPMVGGLFSAALLTLVVLPASYMLIQRFRYRNQLQAAANGRADDEREVTRPTLSDESSDGVS